MNVSPSVKSIFSILGSRLVLSYWLASRKPSPYHITEEFIFFLHVLKLAASHRLLGIPRWLRGKESSCQWRTCRRYGFDPRVGKIPWRKAWQPIPVFLSGESPWTEEPGTVESMVGGVTKSWAQFSRHTHTHTHCLQVFHFRAQPCPWICFFLGYVFTWIFTNLFRPDTLF